MKLLLDTCVWGGAKLEIHQRGHDVLWTGDMPSDPGDDEILNLAREQGRVLVTLDKDFGELVFLKGLSHAGIIRLAEIPSKVQGQVILSILQDHGDELTRGAIVTVTQNRIRLRLPLGG